MSIKITTNVETLAFCFNIYSGNGKLDDVIYTIHAMRE